jgi:hypothetical protein
MTLDTLRLLRNILLRSFVVGVAFGLLFGIITFAGWNTWIGMATSLCHTDEATLTKLILHFFVDLRFYLVFLLLTPGLALHWTLRKEEARKN